MTPFQPAGDRARWRILYDLLVCLDIGDILTYEAMGEALALHPEDDRHAIQMALRRAAKEHETEDNRALDSVPNEGYRVVLPGEHLSLARRQQKKSHKALERGHSKVIHVDLSGMEPDARKAFEVVAQAFAMQMDFNRRMDIRQQSLETAVTAVMKRNEQTEEQVAELKRRLEVLESTSPTPDDGA